MQVARVNLFNYVASFGIVLWRYYGVCSFPLKVDVFLRSLDLLLFHSTMVEAAHAVFVNHNTRQVPLVLLVCQAS